MVFWFSSGLAVTSLLVELFWFCGVIEGVVGGQELRLSFKVGAGWLFFFGFKLWKSL